MVERGSGSVINMGSIGGTAGIKFIALYGATKAGLHALTKSWTAELAVKGIRVNTVAPGPTLTEDNDDFRPMLEKLAETHPAGRPATGEEVAAAVLFLASGRRLGHTRGTSSRGRRRPRPVTEGQGTAP